jgi:uncharacterized membrane protein
MSRIGIGVERIAPKFLIGPLVAAWAVTIAVYFLVGSVIAGAVLVAVTRFVT